MSSKFGIGREWEGAFYPRESRLGFPAMSNMHARRHPRTYVTPAPYACGGRRTRRRRIRMHACHRHRHRLLSSVFFLSGPPFFCLVGVRARSQSAHPKKIRPTRVPPSAGASPNLIRPRKAHISVRRVSPAPTLLAACLATSYSQPCT